jgi:hypothetical protein
MGYILYLKGLEIQTRIIESNAIQSAGVQSAINDIVSSSSSIIERDQPTNIPPDRDDRRFLVGMLQWPPREYRVIGFVFNDITRLPLLGRAKYPGKSDKWEYFVRDTQSSQFNALSIPFRSKNDNELYDGDLKIKFAFGVANLHSI